MPKETYEAIHFTSDLPVKVFMNQYTHVDPHWHQSIELILVLEGEIDVQVDGEIYHLKPEDLILINSNTTHSMESSGAVTIALQFSSEVFNLTHENIETLTFECNTAIDPDSARYNDLRSNIALLVQNNASSNAGTAYRNTAFCLYLLSELMTKFRSSTSEAARSKRRHANRMTSILEYINTHYRENISLTDLAESQQLSVPYLSSFFNKQMGIGFAQYYVNVKLENAVRDLISSDDPIEIVASRNGFPESHAFVRAFKRKYGTLPSIYRREHTRSILVGGTTNQTNYITLEPTNYLHLLTRYLHMPTVSQPEHTVTTEQRTVPPVSVLQPGIPLRHTFRRMTSVGRASDLMNRSILTMLQDLQHCVGFQYIKFHGILGDEMMLVSRDAEGALHFNFTLVDQVLENAMQLGLKPFVELSFMPSVLASDPGKTIFMRPFNTSPPKSMNEWLMLISEFVRHLISRFGIDEVKTWPFAVWCEPDTPTSMFGWDNPEQFFEFYRRTRQAVKAVCPELSFGTPSTLYPRHNQKAVWLQHFFSYIRSHNCPPDFLNLHYYADVLLATGPAQVGMAPRSHFPEDPNDFRDCITDYRKFASGYGLGDLPIYLSEWNLTFSHRNLINDTIFKSCYMAKNLLENYDRLDSFAYWSLTDLLGENPLPDEMFHGGLGIYTYNGIRKPPFNTIRLAAMLGDELLARGDGYFITRKDNAIKIMLYHYVHYGSLFAAGEAFNITRTERYGIFDMSKKLELSIPLEGLSHKQYLMKEYIVNREHGSAFDHWLTTGALPITSGEATVMNLACSPAFHQQFITPDNSNYLYTPTLEPLEVRLAVFWPM